MTSSAGFYFSSDVTRVMVLWVFILAATAVISWAINVMRDIIGVYLTVTGWSHQAGKIKNTGTQRKSR